MTDTIDLLSNFDTLFRAGKFQEADEILTHINVDQLSSVSMLGILTLTFHAKHKLRNRDAFLAKVEPILHLTLGSDRAERLLRNRR